MINLYVMLDLFWPEINNLNAVRRNIMLSKLSEAIKWNVYANILGWLTGRLFTYFIVVVNMIARLEVSFLKECN